MMKDTVVSGGRSKAVHIPYLQGGGEMGALTRQHDWSATPPGSIEQWPKSLLTALGIILHSKLPMFLCWGAEQIIFYNDAFRSSLGRHHPSALGKQAADIWPGIKPLIEKVLSGSEATWNEDHLLPISANGHMEDVYRTFNCSPVYDDSDQPAGVFAACMEANKNEQVLAHRKARESENNLRNIIMHSPVAMCLLMGSEHVVQIANERMLDIWGKPEEEVLMKPLFSGLADVKGQGFEEIMHHTFATGETFRSFGIPVTLLRHGITEKLYVNLVCEAYKDASGAISGIMVVASEVTDQILSSQRIEAAEARARLATQSAGLGLFELDIATSSLEADERYYQIYGFDKKMTWQEILAAIHPGDVELRQKALASALKTGTLDYQARFIHKDKSVRWIHGRGKVLYDNQGEPFKITGVVQDITEQQQFASELEKKVKERTMELANANLQLQQSNTELNQFAFVASHDLQEPLRKVKTYTGMLESSLTDVSNRSKDFLVKIQDATERMQTLIYDVLKFSQLSNEKEKFVSVDLNDLLIEVISDYELLIEQKNATLTSGTLPVLEAIPFQMTQLFSNLLSNALKYSSCERRLEIAISAKPLLTEEIRHHPELNCKKLYHAIEIRDNGIGFSQEYAKQIFVIFQRLHSRSTYAGTGIGLALCKKIVLNHHGVIYANSEPERGTQFMVILPELQDAAEHKVPEY